MSKSSALTISRFTTKFAKQPAGTVASGFQLAVVFVGMPTQILVNYQNQSTVGLSLWFFLLAGLASVAWAIHAFFEIKTKSWPLFLPQIPSVFFTLVILGQMIYY